MRRLRPLVTLVVFCVTTLEIGAQSSAPTNLTALVSGNDVTLTWQAPAGAVSTYVIEVGSASGLSNLVNVPVGAGTTLFVTRVPVGTYFVRMRSFSPAMGLSGASNEVVVNVVPCVLPAAGGITAIGIGSQVSLTWPVVTGATAYVLEAGSAPTLADLLTVNVGATQSVATAAPAGTYHIRVRGTATGCGVSTSPDTVVRIGSPTGIGFAGIVGAHGAPFTTYSEGGFAVEGLMAPWTISRNYGRPAPFVLFARGGEAAMTGEIRVSAGGTPFRFTSVDIYSSATTIPFVITGQLNSVTVFTLAGTVPLTSGLLATLAGPTGHIAIDTLLISVTNPATPQCATCANNPVGIDNIAVSF